MDITKFIHDNRERAFLVGDYATYRSQLSKQLLKTRKTLGRQTQKNAKQPSTKTTITAEDIGTNHVFAHLQLLTAERAWAFAMTMKATHDEGEGPMPGSRRSHILSRLSKAAKAAEHLSRLLRDDTSTTKATQNDILEAQAYTSTMYGTLEFEKHVSKAPSDDTSVQKSTWRSCLTHFSTAHVIYTALLHNTKSDLFKEVLGNVDPSIRYAAYQARHPRTIAPNQIAKQYFPRSEAALVKSVESLHPSVLASEQAQAKVEAADGALKEVPTTITWRGRTAPIADASIGQSLAATSLAVDKLTATVTAASKGKLGPHTPKVIASAYDPVLNAAQDTVDNVRRAITELNREGVAESDSRMQDLRVTDLAVNYELIAWRVGRNRVLISSPPVSGENGEWKRDDGLHFHAALQHPKPRTKQNENGDTAAPPKDEPKHKQLARLTARVTLYDATLQSLDAAASLRGAARDQNFQAELAAKRDYFSALQCLNIGVSHKLLGHEVEALALFAAAARRAAGLSGEGVEGEKGEVEGLKLGVTRSDLSTLQETLHTRERKQHGLVVLQQAIPPLSSHRNTLTSTPSSTPNPNLNTTESRLTQKQKSTHTDPLINRLHLYPSGRVDLRNLVNYPPRIEPVPVKPIFLDLAWNYIEYPGRAGKVEQVKEVVGREEKEGKSGSEKKRGWFGFGR